MKIRPYEESDESQVVNLWDECELTRPWNNPHKDIARKLKVQRHLFLVGLEAGQIIATAMAGYDGHRGWINYLAVAPSHRHNGYAAELMKCVEALLLEEGCPKLSLQVRASNTKAIEFYRHIGYAQDETVSFGKRLIPDAPAA